MRAVESGATGLGGGRGLCTSARCLVHFLFSFPYHYALATSQMKSVHLSLCSADSEAWVPSGMSLAAELSAVTYLGLPLALPSRTGGFAFPVGATGSVIDGVFPVHPGHRPLVSHLLRPVGGVAVMKLLFPQRPGCPGRARAPESVVLRASNSVPGKFLVPLEAQARSL